MAHVCSALHVCLAPTDLASALPLGDELMFNLLLLSDLLYLPGHHFLVLVHQHHGEQLLKGDETIMC